MVADRLSSEGPQPDVDAIDKVDAALADSTGSYYRQYLLSQGARFDFWAAQGLTGLTYMWGDNDGLRYMPWGRDAALRERAVPVLKIGLADALLRAGLPAPDAAAEVNAALGPPNLTRM